jgi:hypothetical protein
MPASNAVQAKRYVMRDRGDEANDTLEKSMRKIVLVAAGVLVIATAGSLMSSGANAMALGDPAGVRSAAEAVNPVEKAACWRWGWHGPGWYPCGWGGPGWGWRGGWGGRPGWGGGWHRGWGPGGGWHRGWHRW